MKSVRLCVLAGMSFGAAMMAADASAAESVVQGCPTWLGWACRDSALPSKGTRVEAKTAVKRTSKQKQVSETTAAAVVKSKQAQPSKPAVPAETGDRLPMSGQEKEALFEEFLEWRKTRRNIETNR
jgi:hypothetical protein